MLNAHAMFHGSMRRTPAEMPRDQRAEGVRQSPDAQKPDDKVGAPAVRPASTPQTPGRQN